MRIELRGVSKRFDKTVALDDVSLSIAPGQIVAVIGLNGAGKTTLLRSLSGIVAPTRGVILFDGEKFHRERLDLRRRLLLMPDFPAMFAESNALQHASMMLRVYGRDTSTADDVIFRALFEFDMLPLAEMPAGQLSRGQVFKVALIGLLAVQPELWLLDEPFASGLDPQGLAVLKQECRSHCGRGGTVIYTTQILEIAEKFADRLIVIDHGRIVSTYSREQLAALPKDGPESLESRLRQFREVAS